MISIEEYRSLQPGDVILLSKCMNPTIGGTLAVVTRHAVVHGQPCLFAAIACRYGPIGTTILEGRPYAGFKETHFWSKEISEIVTRGSEYYRKNPP